MKYVEKSNLDDIHLIKSNLSSLDSETRLKAPCLNGLCRPIKQLLPTTQ